MRHMMMKRTASAVVLIAMVGGGLAVSTDTDPCRKAYLESGLTAQQMTFDEFRGFYSDTLCARGGDSEMGTTGDRVPGESRQAGEGG
jgi:hypothetical protein